MDRQLRDRYKKTGETFYCPAGHGQHFTESTEQKLRDEIARLEKQIEQHKERAQKYRDRVLSLHDDYRDMKDKRDTLEQLLFERVTGIIEVAEDDYRWSCSCGGHGIKDFPTADDACEAWRKHRRRQGCGESVPETVIKTS